ncbi:2-amino-4-hydroxy-6-hydroxymethyldihydropteridine diphosphokinase [Sphingobacterium sp. NGMCC 1.201703]|uniref:2-amino-4-hydroxy-6- hydroxymethyldihydropteridine diphosphokinase n=1 Tax=unclassified Sphingobacterium TaxID=2609468 RepID=UPI00098469D5|nr:2-amino-4-hydroxy-6-hydroxymethyldihydropteridine diphosphokinase [Sphingobacterium sp. CZ-UAM]
MEGTKACALCATDNANRSNDKQTNTALILLGSNIDSEKNITKALSYIQELGKIGNQTDFIYTKPLQYEDQPDFLNGALLLQTCLSFDELYSELKQIELDMGRLRSKNKNAPRIIDLDVITFNGSIADEKDIVQLPFLYDFVKQLQPEIFKWR